MAKLSGHGKGKWQNKRTLGDYRAKRERLNKIAAQSRRTNR